ncbi:MAG: glutaredoxin 3 [Acidimicrobiales bacterium]|nr:glutaredoxin 3 [Hyphomonadaceae bacterium]RZV40765.1 MAG: glutaredoxin 3 [Acidimicrobiales bacterium]
MKPVTIYTRPMCPYCWRATALLKKKNVNFEEINAGFDAKLRAEMIQRANGSSTYPQIFIGEDHIGGCDEMLVLERDGKLDGMLAG